MKYEHLYIILITYNQSAITQRCLNSLSKLLKLGTHCTIVDNGSSDSTIADIKALHLPNINIIGSRNNLGVARARNIALKALPKKCEYILILDNDTIVNPEAIDSMMQYMDEHPDTGLIGPRLTSPDGITQHSFLPFPGIGEKIRNLLSKSNNIVANIPQQPFEPFYVIGACQMIRRDIVDKVGLLDESIFFGPEDADYCMRVRQVGFRIIYLPSAVIIHDWQQTSRHHPFSPLALKHIRGLLHFYMRHKRFI